MKKILIYYFSFLVLLSNLNIININSFPYQKPHSFNPTFLNPKYYPLGDITLYGSDTYTLIYQGTLPKAPGRPKKEVQIQKKVIPPNQPFTMLYLFLDKSKAGGSKDQHSGTSKMLDNFFDTHGYYLQRKVDIALIPNNKSRPIIRVLIRGTDINKDEIHITIGVPGIKATVPIVDPLNPKKPAINKEIYKQAPQGFKLIFNTKNFAHYVTQSYFYDNLGHHDTKGLLYGFAFNTDKINLSQPKDETKTIDGIFPVSVLWNNMELTPINKLLKIKEKNVSQNMSYNDFFIGKDPVLKIQGLTDKDYDKLSKIDIDLPKTGYAQ